MKEGPVISQRYDWPEELQIQFLENRTPDSKASSSISSTIIKKQRLFESGYIVAVHFQNGINFG